MAASPGLTPRQVGVALARRPGRGSGSGSGSGMEYPVAVLREADRGVLQTDSQSVLLSTGSLTEHLAAHPEIGLSDYQKLQALIDRSEIYVGADDTRNRNARSAAGSTSACSSLLL